MNLSLKRLAAGVLLFMAVGTSLHAQNKKGGENLFAVTDAQIEEYVQEVYQQEANAVFNNKNKYAEIKEFLQDRFQIFKMNEGYMGKANDLQKFSTVDLFNSNNLDLKRDVRINPKQFNPLKYEFPLSYQYPVVYVTDDMEYVIIVLPSKENPVNQR